MMKRRKLKTLTCLTLSLLIINILLNVPGLDVVPQAVNASAYSGAGAYIFRDNSKQNMYFFNSSSAGFLWNWEDNYPGIQDLGDGGQFRIHSNYGYDLKPEMSGYSVVYWEYEDGMTDTRIHSGSTEGGPTQTILRNASDFSLVRFVWSDSRMNHAVYYGFWNDKPYVWVYIERTMNQDMIAQNSQTCNMLSKNFRKFWWTDYTGEIVNWNYTGTDYRYAQPLFSALDNKVMNGYPFMACYSDAIKATVGFIYLDSTSNIRKDTHLWGFEFDSRFTEVQVDWGGETDGGRRLWQKNTTMGLEYLVFAKSGLPTDDGNIADYSRWLYNDLSDVKGDVDTGIWSAAHQRFRDFNAIPGYPVGICGHNPYVASVIGMQPRTYYIPYMDQVSLMPYGSMDEDYYSVPLYSKWYFRFNPTNTVELDNQLVNESVNRTIAGEDAVTAMIGWDKGNVTAYSHVKAFRDSDKLLFYGNVTLDSNSSCIDSSFTLYFNKVNASVKISETEYDIRFIDPLFGWSGLYIKVDNGIILQYSDRLEIRLFNFSTPQNKPAGTTYGYNFTLWGHPGNATGVTPFFTKQPLTYERLFSNYALDNSSFGFESMKGYVVINSTYSSGQLTTYIMNLTNGQKTVEIFVRDKGAPESVTVNGSPVSFNYDGSTRIVSFNTVSSSVKRIVLSWPLVDSQPPSYRNVGYNTTLAKSPCQFYSLWQDNNGLSGYIFSTNNSGTWVNDTWVSLTGNSAWANITKTLNSQGDLVIGYKWYCNDTSNNWNDTGILALTTIWGDIQPPTYSNIGTNTSVASNPCQFSCYWQDNGGLSGYIFSTNNSGVWVNDTFEGLGGLAGWANKTKILAGTVGNVVGYRWYCVDSSNNSNDTGIRTITTTYSSKPQYSNVSYSTAEQNRPCVFSSFWTDDQALSGYIFGTDVTGTWTNDTFSALSGQQSWANKTKTLANTAGVRVEFQYWCSDSQNQWNTTGLQYLVTTPGQPPAYSNVGYNLTLAGNTTLFSCYWQDGVGLSGYIFSWNGTGAWQNETWTAINGLSAWSNVTKTLPSTVGMLVGFRWYCNDTDNNWNSTQVQTLTTTVQAQSGVFGKTTIGASQDTVPPGYVVACRFQAPADGTATQISAYVRGKYGSGLAKAMIYSDVSGNVGTLLFESSQIALSSSWAWHNFTANYHIQSGSYYWFAVYASVESQFAYTTVQTNQEAYAWGWTYPVVFTSFSGGYGPAYTNHVVSIYATYELPVETYSLTVSSVGTGSVSLNNTGPYHLGDVVQLTATPNVGWSFSGWSGALTGSANPADLTVTGNMAVTAIFTQDQYMLTMYTTGQGSVVPGNQTFASGTVVDIKAINAVGWTFADWSGGASGSANTTVTMNGPVSVTATFTQNTYTLTVSNTGNGSVNLNNSGPYHYGDVVELAAVPDAGWSFSGWSGALSGSANPADLTITGNMVATATFTQNTYTLTVTTSGSGSVVLNNTGQYHHGDTVQLTANPTVGWSFAHWSGDLSGSVNPTTILIDRNKGVTAAFTQNTYSLTVSAVGSGSVSLNNSGPYYYGDVVELTAVPAAEWSFQSWSGDLLGSTNPSTIVINWNMVVTATFTENAYSLTVSAMGSGSVVKVPDQAVYDWGTNVTLTANPTIGWSFDHWSGDASGVVNPVTVNMTSDKAVTATFTQNVYTLTVGTVGNGNVNLNNTGQYHYGDIVELAAVPATGWSFQGWSGDLSGSANPSTILINGNKAGTATFTQNTYTLTIMTVGSGSLSLNNSGPYYYGDTVELTANPATGWSFDHWSEDLAGSMNPETLIINGDKAVTATFSQSVYTLVVNVVGNGVVNLNNTGPYHYSDIVELTAVSGIGWNFSGWGGDLSGSLNPGTIIIDGNKAATATFTQNIYNLTVSTVGSGSVNLNNSGPYYYGDVVQLAAVPAAGWSFSGWSGALSGSANPADLTVTGNLTVTATFASGLPSAVFGNTTVGASTNTLPAGYVVACKFQAPANGTATMVSAYIRAKYQSGFAKIAVYSDNAGQAGSLLFESNETILSTGWAWYNFSVNYELQAGKYYWFTIFTSVESQFRYGASQTSQQAVAWGWSYPTVPTAFNGKYGPTYANRVVSIFVTYTPKT